MKVKGNESGDRPRISELAQQDAVRISNSKAEAALLAKKLKAQIEGSSDSVVDKVDLGLAKYLNAELNAEKLANERKDKIEKLKKMIESGEYQPDSMLIAQALTQEIEAEIFFKPNDFSSADKDLLDEEV